MSEVHENAEGGISLLVVDDHRLVSETLESGLSDQGFACVDIACTINAAVQKIQARGQYDVVLLDYSLPGVHGLQAFRQLIDLNKGHVALFSGVAGWWIVQAALEQGASGYIPKTMPLKALAHAIRLISAGDTYLPSDYIQRFSGFSDPVKGLKPREMRVLAHLCEGMQNKEIGREVGVEEVIVKMDVKSICRKLGARNRTEAVLAAFKLGLF